MNIFELLSFNFMEFVNSPAGILIIVGILLLIVGIVMFLMDGNGKKETEGKAPVTEEVKEEVKPEETVAPVENTEPVVEAVAEEAPIVVETEGDGVKEVNVEPVAETINFTETTPAVEEPAVEQPQVENLVSPVEPVVEPVAVEPVVETPAVEAPVVEAPAVEPVVESLDTPAPTIYGGASPEVTTEVLDEKPREIYGGANPLENTAPIPTVKVTEEAKVEEPAVEAPAVEPVVEPVVEAVQEEKKEELEKLEF